MNHKRRRPKNRRAGCLFCKPYKMNGLKHAKNMLRRQKLREMERAKETDWEP